MSLFETAEHPIERRSRLRRIPRLDHDVHICPMLRGRVSVFFQRLGDRHGSRSRRPRSVSEGPRINRAFALVSKSLVGCLGLCFGD